MGLNAINVVSSCFRFVWQSKAVSYTSYGGVVPHNMQDLLFIWPCLVGCKNLDTKALKKQDNEMSGFGMVYRNGIFFF